MTLKNKVATKIVCAQQGSHPRVHMSKRIRHTSNFPHNTLFSRSLPNA